MSLCRGLNRLSHPYHPGRDIAGFSAMAHPGTDIRSGASGEYVGFRDELRLAMYCPYNTSVEELLIQT